MTGEDRWKFLDGKIEGGAGALDALIALADEARRQGDAATEEWAEKRR